MNYKISFQEMSELAIEGLRTQGPITLEQARTQANWIKSRNITIQKKAIRGHSQEFLKKAD